MSVDISECVVCNIGGKMREQYRVDEGYEKKQMVLETYRRLTR